MCTLQFLGQITVGVVIIWVTQSHSRWQLILFPKTKWNWKYVIFGFLGIISKGIWNLFPTALPLEINFFSDNRLKIMFFWCDLIKWWSTAWRPRKWVFLEHLYIFEVFILTNNHFSCLLHSNKVLQMLSIRPHLRMEMILKTMAFLVLKKTQCHKWEWNDFKRYDIFCIAKNPNVTTGNEIYWANFNVTCGC